MVVIFCKLFVNIYVTLFKNTSLKIEELYLDGQDVEDFMGSDYESQLKNKIFYA